MDSPPTQPTRGQDTRSQPAATNLLILPNRVLPASHPATTTLATHPLGGTPHSPPATRPPSPHLTFLLLTAAMGATLPTHLPRRPSPQRKVVQVSAGTRAGFMPSRPVLKGPFPAIYSVAHAACHEVYFHSFYPTVLGLSTFPPSWKTPSETENIH